MIGRVGRCLAVLVGDVPVGLGAGFLDGVAGDVGVPVRVFGAGEDGVAVAETDADALVVVHAGQYARGSSYGWMTTPSGRTHSHPARLVTEPTSCPPALPHSPASWFP